MMQRIITFSVHQRWLVVLLVTLVGLFGFYAATAHKDVAELMPVALACIREAVDDLSEEDMQRAKAQMKVAWLAALESSAARAEPPVPPLPQSRPQRPASAPDDLLKSLAGIR